MPFFIDFDALKCPFSKVAPLHFQFLAGTLTCAGFIPDWDSSSEEHKPIKSTLSWLSGCYEISDLVSIFIFLEIFADSNELLVGNNNRISKLGSG